MQIKIIKQPASWERFILSSRWTPFFQSWAFGQAQARIGVKVLRLGVFKQDKPLMLAQVFGIRAKRGPFLHLRHGPVFDSFSTPAFISLIDYLKDYAYRHGYWWIRVSPLIEAKSKPAVFDRLGFINAPVPNQNAENCLIIDLRPSLEAIFQGFRKTHRNLIRKATRLGIIIKHSRRLADIDLFFDLYYQTARRQGFTPHQGIKEEYQELLKRDQAGLFLGYHQNRLLSAALIVFYGKQAVYHHSGSVRTKLPVNYLLQWEVIKTAKQRGFQIYNLWGVSPPDKPNHPWRGLSHFKAGFGGKRQDFMHAQDLPLRGLYRLSYLYQKLWKLYKGY